MQDRLRRAQQRARKHEEQVEEQKKQMIISAWRRGDIKRTGENSYSIPGYLFVEGCTTMVADVVEEYLKGGD